MTTPKLYIHVVKISPAEHALLGISLDKKTWFRIPEELRNIKQHKELLTLKTVSNTIKSISKVGGFRKIAVTFKTELRKLYQDDEENFCIGDFMLEEYQEADGMADNKGESPQNESLIIHKINELQLQINSSRKINLNEIEKKFLITKFNGRQDAAIWMDSLEKECLRCEISDDNTKVEILKMLVEGNVKEWYSANVIKLSTSDWCVWKRNFLMTYEKKNWSPICTAFGFKYISGPLMEYVIKKERLLLEADKDIPELFRIYQIVFNLPVEIRNKLEREKIKNMEELMSEVKKINDYDQVTTNWEVKKNEEKKKDSEKNKLLDNQKGKKTPCKKCESLGFRNRYHPIQACWNKKIYRGEVNIAEEDKDEENQIYLQDNDIEKN